MANLSVMENKRAILFDFDGTLAPNLDLPGMRHQVVEFTRSLGVPDDVFAGQYIIEVIDVSADWMGRQGADKASVQAYQKQANQIILDIELGAAALTSPFAGVRELLGRLSEVGIRSGVVTRNCRQAVLQTFPDILQCVDVLHARDDVSHVKPDTRHLSDTLDQLGVHPTDAAMVGDGALDMKSGKAIGMTCVGVLTGSADEPQLLQAGADVVLADCLKLLDK